MTDEDKKFGGSLVLALRIWWRHVKTLCNAWVVMSSRKKWCNKENFY